MEMKSSINTEDNFFTILKRRKRDMIIPFVSIFFVFAVVAFVLPPIYKSTSTILIEQQVIPADFVKTTVTMYAEQQLQIINQRIMSSQRLLEIISRFKLYDDLRVKRSSDEIIQKMREDIKLEPISTNVIDPNTGKPTAITIAFCLSYEGTNDPDKVLQIANVLASLFLEENVQARTQQAAEVSGFFEDEVVKVKNKLEAIDASIAQFKEKHMNNLPELLHVNMQSLHDTERDLETLYNQRSQLKEKEGYLQTQLANLSPDFKEGDKQRLDQLNVLLVNLKNKFSAEHPDVVNTKAEIIKLEERIKASANSKKSTYRPDNPAYITLASQLASVRAEMASGDSQIRELKSRQEDYKARINITPNVEQEYKAILMEQNNTQEKYNDLTRKLMESKVSQGVERQNKGERFTIIDPARLQEKPYKPNRMAILLVGLVLGLGAGVGTASVKEFTDTFVRTAATLTLNTSFPVLGSIPEIMSENELEQKHGKRDWRIIGLIIVFVVGLVAAFHFLVMNIDVFFVKILSKLGM